MANQVDAGSWKQELDSSGLPPSGYCRQTTISSNLPQILGLLKHEFGTRLVLHEGGPTLFGQFLADGLVDELCLTVVPQVAGRVPTRPRPALVMNWEFFPGTAPWLDLLSVKRGGDHSYLRYRLRGSDRVVREEGSDRLTQAPFEYGREAEHNQASRGRI